MACRLLLACYRWLRFPQPVTRLPVCLASQSSQTAQLGQLGQPSRLARLARPPKQAGALAGARRESEGEVSVVAAARRSRSLKQMAGQAGQL